jgi:glycosyltransferase involved in cell wall biosynthesis
MTSPRKVFYFIWSLQRGGAERQLVELIRGLTPARYVASLALSVGVDEFGVELSSPRHDLGAENGFNARHFARLVSAIRKEKPSVVHSYMGSMNLYARLAAKAAGVPVVIGSVRCTQLLRADVVREALSWPLVQATVVNSVGIRDELVTRAKVARSHIEVIENGIDLQKFSPSTRLVRDTVQTVVVPGRVSAQKNQHALIEALGILKRANQLPTDVRFVFAGRDEQSDYAASVRTTAKRENVEHHLVWRGVVDAMNDLYNECDALLLPSIFEGLPNVVIEAMACGVPVVVSPPANADNLVTDGVEGLTLNETSPQAIAEGLRRLFALPGTTRAAMGVAGRAHTEKRFATQVMVNRTMALYDRLLARH